MVRIAFLSRSITGVYKNTRSTGISSPKLFLCIDDCVIAKKESK